ncbi:helix-turn-helix protein, partial [Gramella sp. Hel_I_59]
NKGVSQDRVVDLTGIPKRSYVNYENGQTDIPISKLQNIASALNVSVSELLGEKIKENKNISILKEEGLKYERTSSITLEKLQQDVRQVNANVVSLNEGITKSLESLANAAMQGLKNDLKLIRWTESVDNKRILKVAEDLETFLNEYQAREH